MTAAHTPTNATHTPGPWLADPHSNQVNVASDDNRDGYSIALALVKGPNWPYAPSLAMATANQRLIAAAPAMYEALAALLETADAINEGFDPFTSMNCLCSDEAQKWSVSPVAPENAPCSTCRHRRLKLKADAARAALRLARGA